MLFLNQRAWNSEEFWTAIDCATEYAGKIAPEVDKAMLRDRVLAQLLDISRPMGWA